LAGQHPVLWLIRRIGAIGMRDRGKDLRVHLSMMSGLARNGLSDQQRRGGFVSPVVISAPQWRLAIELLEHSQNHPCRIVDRRRVAASVIGELQRLVLLQALQEATQKPVGAVIQQPAETQQYMPRTQRT